ATQRAEVSMQRAARAVAEERLRIAQELHDVVAHSISVIAVQAGVGSHFLDDSAPAEARDALDAISQTSRATLAELRRLLGVLRGEDGAPSRQPAPTLSDIGELVERTRELGVPVTLDVRGTPDAEHRAVEMSAYRVIQEALTNVIKHAGETRRVEVTVAHRRDGLDVEVADDGRGLAQPTSSDLPSGQHGLLGMRERVEVWGGTLDAGPRPGGGFTVRATFPYEPAFAVEA
ncbi:MAG: sensor histidine kinase, partial [Acidimicrobiales bacterium]|nr:sensor histidine kinase [Acidimicrobiales bacterium]